MNLPGLFMAEDNHSQDLCIACICDVLETLRNAAVRCDEAPLSTLLQNALEEAARLRGEDAQCNCNSNAEEAVDKIMRRGEAQQLLEFVSAVAMLDEADRDKLADELESAQQNNLLDHLH